MWQLVGQSVSQCGSHLVSQSVTVSWSVSQSVSVTVTWSVNQSVWQLVGQPVSQCDSHLVSHSISVTVSRSVSQSVWQSLGQPVNQCDSPSVIQSVWQLVSQSVSQCGSQSVRLIEEQSDVCKGNKFLRKLRRRGVLKDNFWINWVDNVNWPSMWRVSKADISSVSYYSERIEELWVVHVCLYAGNEARLLVQDLDCLSVRVSLSINSFCTLTICMTFSAATITCGSLWSLSFGNDKKRRK